MNIQFLHHEYTTLRTTPVEVIRNIYARIAAEGLHPIWISVLPEEEVLRRAASLSAADRSRLPLFGIPFAVKDNIDVAGLPTTAACATLLLCPGKVQPQC